MMNPEEKKQIRLYEEAKKKKAEKKSKRAEEKMEEAEELAKEYEAEMEKLLEEGKWEEFLEEWLRVRHLD